jgi:MFS family permease
MATNIYAVTSYLVLIGFCLSLFIPYIFGALLGAAPKGSETLAVSVGMVGSNLGSFSSPYISSFFARIFGNTTASFALGIAGAGFLMLTVIFFVDILRKRKQVANN